MNWKIIRAIDAYLGIPLMYMARFLKKLLPSALRPDIVEDPRRILLVKFWGVGNLFMMMPSVHLLRKAYPDAEIDLFTLESNREAAECLRAFGAVYAQNTKGYLSFFHTAISAVAALRRRDYDIVIDFEQFARFSALCTALIGKRISIGFSTASQHRHILFSHTVHYDNTLHTTLSYCSLARAAGADGTCTLFGEQLRKQALAGRNGGASPQGFAAGPEETIVVFHVGTSENFSERRWPAGCYAVLADLLIERHGALVLLTGLDNESYLASEVVDRTRRRDRVTNLCGRLGFEEYFRLIAMSDLVVSADTAAVHIASALGVPVAGLYGPNTPALYGPWGSDGIAFYGELRCSPCITNFNAKTHICRHPDGKGACMRKISPEEVYQRIRGCYFQAVQGQNRENAKTCSR